jgi:hypothetical protein
MLSVVLLPGTALADTQSVSAVRGPNSGDSYRCGGAILRDPLLGLSADVLDDLEAVRNANQNRLRQLTRTGPDKDGENRGFGLTTDHPDVARLAHLVDGLSSSYDESVKNLQRIMRQHPLGPWCKATSGIGEKQLARLLAAIGDPYWNELYDRPRTVSELWAYCGMDVRDGQAPKLRRGQKVNWSTAARMRVHLIAESCMKARTSPYRPVYDATRAKYEDAIHTFDCPQCKATAGQPLKPGHQNARALRAVSKAVLKDLWIEAKRLHEPPAAATSPAKPMSYPLLPGLDQQTAPTLAPEPTQHARLSA